MAHNTYAELPEIDPRGGELYFDINFQPEAVEEAVYGDYDDKERRIARKLKKEEGLTGPRTTFARLTRAAAKNAAKLLGKPVTPHNPDSFDNLEASVKVKSYAELDRMIDSIRRADANFSEPEGEDLSYAVTSLGDSPFHRAGGYLFLPQGVGGPQYRLGEIFERRKLKMTSKQHHSR